MVTPIDPTPNTSPATAPLSENVSGAVTVNTPDHPSVSGEGAGAVLPSTPPGPPQLDPGGVFDTGGDPSAPATPPGPPGISFGPGDGTGSEPGSTLPNLPEPSGPTTGPPGADLGHDGQVPPSLDPGTGPADPGADPGVDPGLDPSDPGVDQTPTTATTSPFAGAHEGSDLVGDGGTGLDSGLTDEDQSATVHGLHDFDHHPTDHLPGH